VDYKENLAGAKRCIAIVADKVTLTRPKIYTLWLVLKYILCIKKQTTHTTMIGC